MGVRGEIFSNRILLPNRTYFFNIKENRMGDLYLNIVESKNRDNGGFDRQSVILFADDLQEFLKGFDESLRVMEKAMREKRHSGKAEASVNRNEEKRERPRRNEEGRESRDRLRRDDEGRNSRERPRRNEEGRESRDRPRRDDESRNSRERPRRNEQQGGYNSRAGGDRSRGNERKKHGAEQHSRPRSESGENFSSDRRPKKDRRVVVRKKD